MFRVTVEYIGDNPKEAESFNGAPKVFEHARIHIVQKNNVVPIHENGTIAPPTGQLVLGTSVVITLMSGQI